MHTLDGALVQLFRYLTSSQNFSEPLQELVDRIIDQFRVLLEHPVARPSIRNDRDGLHFDKHVRVFKTDIGR